VVGVEVGAHDDINILDPQSGSGEPGHVNGIGLVVPFWAAPYDYQCSYQPG
jgi:hypothetical protein